MLPIGSDPRALRAKLLEYLGNVKQFFEATNVGFNMNASPYWSAFDALRRNKPLAEEFVTQLTTLLDFLDRELAPALLQAQNQAPASAAQVSQAPAGPWPAQPGVLAAPASFPGLPGAMPSPLPGGSLGSMPGFNSDETQILDRASPAQLIQRIASSDPVPRAPAPTPGMTNRRPDAAASEPVRVSTPPRPATPPRGMPPVAPVPPPPSHDDRPMGDVAGELSLADVLIADRDLLADPSGPPIPQPSRRPSEAHLPGVAREIRKSIPPAPAARSVQAEEPPPAAKRAALLAAALEAPEPAKPTPTAGRAAAPTPRVTKATPTIAASPSPAAAPVVAAAAAAPAAVPTPTPAVEAPKGIKLPPIAKPSKTATVPVVASSPDPAPAAAPTVVGGTPLSADAVRPAAAAVKPAAKDAKASAAKPVAAEKVAAPDAFAPAEKPTSASMPPVVEKAAVVEKAVPASKPAIALPGVGKPASAAGKATLATKAAPAAESKPSPPIEVKPVEVKPVEVKPVEVKPVAAKPVEAKPVAAKPAAAAKPAVVAPAAAKPAPAAKPVAAVKVSAAKAAAVKVVAEKAPVFDQSDMSDPSMSPSQFFRVYDAKLPFDDEK